VLVSKSIFEIFSRNVNQLVTQWQGKEKAKGAASPLLGLIQINTITMADLPVSWNYKTFTACLNLLRVLMRNRSGIEFISSRTAIASYGVLCTLPSPPAGEAEEDKAICAMRDAALACINNSIGSDRSQAVFLTLPYSFSPGRD
jgi:hypothetical protein